MDPENEGAPEEGVVEEVATEGAPEGEAVVEEAPEPSVLDRIFGEEPPASIRALEDVADKDGDFKVSQEDFDALPIHAKQLFTNLRRMATRKTQETATERKALLGQQRELAQQQQTLQEERAKLFAIFSDPRLQALVKPPEGEAPDPFTPEGQKYAAQQAFSELMGGFLQEFDGISQEQQAALKELQEQQAMEVRRAELVSFIDRTPDWDEYKEDVRALVKEKGYHYEDAYHMARGRRPPAPPQEDPIEAARSASRRAAGRGGATAGQGLTLEQLKARSSY